MKKPLSLLLAAALCVSLAACGGGSEKPAGGIADIGGGGAQSAAPSAAGPDDAAPSGGTQTPADAVSVTGDRVIYTSGDGLGNTTVQEYIYENGVLARITMVMECADSAAAESLYTQMTTGDYKAISDETYQSVAVDGNRLVMEMQESYLAAFAGLSQAQLAAILGGEAPSAAPSGGAQSAAWPAADFITPGMAYTGGGEITVSDFIDGSTQEGGMSLWSVYIDGASLEDAAAYVDALKADGFAWYGVAGLAEPEVKFEFGYYSWAGAADGGARFVTVYVSEEPDVYGGSGKAYTMSIQMMNQNPYE